MSARSALAEAIAGEPCSCGLSDCPRPEVLIDAFKAEVLRKAAERIRRGWEETRGATQASKVMAFAADLIDPDKDN